MKLLASTRQCVVRGCVIFQQFFDICCLRLPQDIDGDDLKLDDFDCPLREWLSEEKVKRAVKKKFGKFLVDYKAQRNNEKVYVAKIVNMCEGADFVLLLA